MSWLCKEKGVLRFPEKLFCPAGSHTPSLRIQKKPSMPDSRSEDSTYLPASAVEGAQMLRGHPPGTPA